jgi:hypothetical protein
MRVCFKNLPKYEWPTRAGTRARYWDMVVRDRIAWAVPSAALEA